MDTKINWTNGRRKASELKGAEYNPRQMTEAQVARLAASIDKFSLVDPIIVNKDGTVIGGHMRLRVLAMKGVQEVDVRVPDRQLTEAEERELNLRLNKNNGEWDWDKLMEFDEDMLTDVGFEAAELAWFLDPKVKDESGEVKTGALAGDGSSKGGGFTVCPECGYSLKNDA